MDNKNVWREVCNDVRDACVEKTNAGTVDDVLKAFIEVCSEVLEHGGSIGLPNFGSFNAQFVKGRKGINPKTQESLDIPDKYKVKFKSFQKLTEKVQNNLKGQNE